MSQDRAQFFTVNIQDGPSKKKNIADSEVSGHMVTWKNLYPERTSLKTYGTRIIIQNYAMPNCVHGQPYILHMFLTTREALRPLQRRPCFTVKPVKTELSVMSHYDKRVSPEFLRGF